MPADEPLLPVTEGAASAGEVGPDLLRRARALAWPQLARLVASAVLLLLTADQALLFAGLADAGHAPALSSMVAEITGRLAMLLALWRPLPGAASALVPLALNLAVPPSGVELLLVAVATGCVTATATRREVLAMGAIAAGYIVLRGVTAPDLSASAALSAALLVGVGTGAAVRAARSRRRWGRTAREAERLRTARIRREERRILAAELHDGVAHQLSNAKLQVMGHRATDDPRQLHTALDHVERATGSALAELRLLVRVLRDDPGTGARGREVEELGECLPPTQVADRAARTLIDHGLVPLIDLPPAADQLAMTAQRTLARVIVQGVANMRDHAPTGSRCEIGLVAGDAHVVLRLVNPLPPTHDPTIPWGGGLRSLAERVDLTGGRFSAGPVGADWVLTATLPHE